MSSRSGLRVFRSLLTRLSRKTLGYNRVLDRKVQSLDTAELGDGVEHAFLDLGSDEFRQWLEEGGLSQRGRDFVAKKALEFFFSARILDPAPGDSLLDAAGGRSGYLEAVRAIYGCRELFLHDHIYADGTGLENGIKLVGGDASSIPLGDGSVTRISCHHAFEHFQDDTDVRFVEEVARLLGPGGRACLIPLFLSRHYTECWNVPGGRSFDERATLLFDATATLPGGDEDGHFCRIYDLRALEDRVLDTARGGGLNVRIVTCRLDGRDLPDGTVTAGSRLNRPLRALVLERKGVGS